MPGSDAWEAKRDEGGHHMRSKMPRYMDYDEEDSENGYKKGAWTPEEDAALHNLIMKHGARNWSEIALGVRGRSGKSCRLRWCNQLNPDVKKDPFSEWEDAVVINAHKIHGNKWAAIAKLLPGRTDNSVKNHWNSTLNRQWQSGGLENRFMEEGVDLDWLLNNPEEETCCDSSDQHDLQEYNNDQGDSVTAEAFAYSEQRGLKRKRSPDGDDLSDLQGSHTHYDGSRTSSGGSEGPSLPEAMRMLNALPESVKGCLLEAARLCGPAAPLAQRNLLAQWSSQRIARAGSSGGEALAPASPLLAHPVHVPHSITPLHAQPPPPPEAASCKSSPRLLAHSAAELSPTHLLGCSTPEMYSSIPTLMLSPCAPAITPVRPSPADTFFGSTLRGIPADFLETPFARPPAAAELQDWAAPLSSGLTPPPIPLFNGADAGVGVRVIHTALFRSGAKPEKAA